MGCDRSFLPSHEPRSKFLDDPRYLADPNTSFLYLEGDDPPRVWDPEEVNQMYREAIARLEAGREAGSRRLKARQQVLKEEEDLARAEREAERYPITCNKSPRKSSDPNSTPANDLTLQASAVTRSPSEPRCTPNAARCSEPWALSSEPCSEPFPEPCSEPRSEPRSAPGSSERSCTLNAARCSEPRSASGSSPVVRSVNTATVLIPKDQKSVPAKNHTQSPRPRAATSRANRNPNRKRSSSSPLPLLSFDESRARYYASAAKPVNPTRTTTLLQRTEFSRAER